MMQDEQKQGLVAMTLDALGFLRQSNLRVERITIEFEGEHRS